jgi:hypothetical protein
MPKDVLITPANSAVEFKDTSGNIDAIIQLDDSGNLNITNPGGSLSVGDVTSNVYVGDGSSVVDIIYEQNGAIRALTGKTLTVGQSDSFVNVAANLTNGLRVTTGNVGIGTNNPTSNLHVMGNANITNTLTATLMSYREFAITNTAVTGANTINLRSANWFDCTLTGNSTFTFSNAPASGNVFQFTVITRQNATGGRTVSWANTVYWAGGQVPPTTTAANGRDVWSFVTIDGGSTFFGTLSIKDAK